MARHLDKVLDMRGGLNTLVYRECAERKSVGNPVQSLHAGKVRCKTLDVALVEELAGLDEVSVSFLELALLDDHLLLVSLAVFNQELLISVVDLGMGVPQTFSNPLAGGIFEIEEDSILGGRAIPEHISNKMEQLRHLLTPLSGHRSARTSVPLFPILTRAGSGCLQPAAHT